jgi:GTPase SAR1 family protein
MGNVNNYDIITLGASGAGKTVFLSSLFKSLSIQGDHRFFLEVGDSKMEQLLNKFYSEILSGDWPEGTRGDIQKWAFTCCVKNPNNLEQYSACQFTYIDYAGGLLTDIDSEDEGYDFNFDQEIEKADAVLALLDGSKLLKFMDDKESDNRDISNWIQRDIPCLMRLVQKCKKIPVHFVISKWDLLVNKYTLLEVRNRLLEKVNEFKNVVKNRADAKCPVRLIPISSIGINFMTPQADGSMKKFSGAVLSPFQVEVPLAFVLTDGLQAKISQLKDEQKEIGQRPTEIKPKYGFLNRLDQLLSSTVLPGYNTLMNQLLVISLPEKYKNNPAL